MAGTDAASQRRRVQRQIARELRAGQYRPRASKLTVRARQLASYRPLVEQMIFRLGLDGTPEERKYQQSADDAYRDKGLQWIQTRLNRALSDTRAYAEDQNIEPGHTSWEAREDVVNEMLYYYHGVVWAYI